LPARPLPAETRGVTKKPPRLERLSRFPHLALAPGRTLPAGSALLHSCGLGLAPLAALFPLTALLTREGFSEAFHRFLRGTLGPLGDLAGGVLGLFDQLFTHWPEVFLFRRGARNQ